MKMNTDMAKKTKKRFFLNHRKSSALVVSVVIHAAFIAVALVFVAVSVVQRNEVEFVPQPVNRPNLRLRKLQVPVNMKKPRQAPKLRKTIVVKTRTPNMDIKMPEIVGVKGGLGSGVGAGGGSLGFSFGLDMPSLWGYDKPGNGNEFVGTFFDLKQFKDGSPSEIGALLQEEKQGDATAICNEIIGRFIRTGFNPNRFNDYFKAPVLKYATAFSMPYMRADEAPKAYSVAEQVQPAYWVCHYKGRIAAPEDGKYRFWGLGDDVLAVRIGTRLVIDACWIAHEGRMSDWLSRDPDNRKFSSDTGYGGEGAAYMNTNSRLVIGDWFDLDKGKPVDIDILIGEVPGGWFSCRLLIEQQGKEYPMVESDAGLRPVLPIFKTAPVDEKLLSQMKINPDTATADGPVFGVLENTK